MDRCDVLIVGGGPAGSSCAFGLRRAGLDVVIIDQAEFPRDKVCAGWITLPILSELEIDVADYRKERVFQPLRGFRLGRMGDARADGDRGEVVSYGIRRCEFDQYLIERCGARTRLGERVRSLHRSEDLFVVNDALAAPVLVGAGGHFCPVARSLGAAPGADEAAVLAREIEFRLDPEQQDRCPTQPELPELFFTEDLKGYGWVVRKGEYLNVGLGRLDQDALSAHVERFLDALEAGGWLPPGVRGRLDGHSRREGHGRRDGHGRLLGHAYLVWDRSRRVLARDGTLMLGDAAGLAFPKSGEGIRPAVESGLLAARAILEAGPRGGAELASRYRRAIEARFGPQRGAPGHGPTDWLPAAWRGPVSGFLLARDWFARHVVVDGWFLHRRDPPLPAALAPSASASAGPPASLGSAKDSGDPSAA